MKQAARQGRLAGAGLVLLALVAALALPHLLRAEEDAITFASTGQTLTNEHGFLSFWREQNGERLLGAAISAPLEENGLTVQYFERGRLEQHLALEGALVLPGRIGADYADTLWRSFEPATFTPAGGQLFEQTGHTLSGPFQAFWQANGSLAMLGYPLSEPLWEYVGNQMLQVQYFERGRLEHHPLAAGTPGEVALSNLGQELAVLRGVQLSAPAPAPAPEVAVEAAPVQVAPVEQAAPAPAPVEPKPAAPARRRAASEEQAVQGNPGGKHIVVDISAQHLYAYNGDTLVFDAPVSTGRDGFNTPTGNFSVYAKLRSQTMEGTIGGEYYRVPDVPHVMYINGGVAIHGTYWHNQFGVRRMSHGCINVPLDAAAWLYKWAPGGTSVRVTR